jgi:hypothetical protein
VACSSVLLLGPPPSPQNDDGLYQLIKHERLSDWTVLVKARGEYEASIRFWRKHGLQTITGGTPDKTFYERLCTMLMEYETVVSGNFSSALLFAASIGKKVVLLRDYTWEIYESSNFLTEVWLESPRARKIVRVFADGKDRETTDASRDLLGFDMVGRPQNVREELQAAIEALDRPFHSHPENPIPYKLAERLALTFKKRGFLRYSRSELLAMMKRRQVCILRMNDIDAWLNGRSEANCSVTPISFRKGVTQPGRAPHGYEPALQSG